MRKNFSILCENGTNINLQVKEEQNNQKYKSYLIQSENKDISDVDAIVYQEHQTQRIFTSGKGVSEYNQEIAQAIGEYEKSLITH